MRGEVQDKGFTLIEVLLAMVIMGLGVTLVLGALGVVTRSSGAYRGQSDVGKALASAAERLLDISTTYQSCASSSGLDAAALSAYNSALAAVDALDATGTTIAVSTSTPVTYWNGSAFTATCYDTTSSPNPGARQELITIEATSAGSAAKDSLQVVKRG